jgi:hypothetical protein
MMLVAIRLCAVALSLALVAAAGEARAQCATMLQYYVNYSKQSSGKTVYPVYVTVSKHFAAGAPPSATPDPVFFEFGLVSATAPPPPNVLSGTGFEVRTSNSNFAQNLAHTASLAIDATGKVTYLEYINGKPVGGMPATVFGTTCANGLAMGYSGSQAWVITFSPGPPYSITQ